MEMKFQGIKGFALVKALYVVDIQPHVTAWGFNQYFNLFRRCGFHLFYKGWYRLNCSALPQTAPTASHCAFEAKSGFN